MVSQRWRSVVLALIGVAAVWAGAIAGYHLFKSSKLTAAKVQAFVEARDLGRLSGDERSKAIQELARKLNALSLEERRKARFARSALSWFEKMTEEEKTWFVEETMPTGFKQMLSSFEQLPEEKRKRAIDDALRGLREARARIALESGEGGGPNSDTNLPPVSQELEARIRTIGLRTFYSQSSAQTKAELAPLLEEIQRNMESGRILRRR